MAKRLIPLPCPFCGSDEFVQSYCNGWQLWSVSCATCKVNMEQEGGGWVKEKDAINCWNNRNSNEAVKQSLFKIGKEINSETRMTKQAKSFAVAIVLNELSDIENSHSLK